MSTTEPTPTPPPDGRLPPETWQLLADLEATMSETRAGYHYSEAPSLVAIATIRTAIAQVVAAFVPNVADLIEPCLECSHPRGAHELAGDGCATLIASSEHEPHGRPCRCLAYRAADPAAAVAAGGVTR